MKLLYFIYIVISFLIVAFGQPAQIAWLSPIAAVFAFALFWFVCLKISSKWRRFWLATLWFFAVQLVQLSWATSMEFVGPFVFVVAVGAALFIGAQFGLLTICLRSLSYSSLLMLSGFWTLLELSRLFYLSGYTWNPVGLALSEYLPTRQLAAFVGVYGLSFFVILTNLFVLKFVKELRFKIFVSATVLVCLPYILGVSWIVYQESKKDTYSDDSLSVLLVQTGIMPDQRLPLNKKTKVLSPFEQWEKILLLLKDYEGRSIDLIVLPEGAIPYSLETPIYDYRYINDYFQMLFGSNEEGLLSLVSSQKKQNGKAVLATNNSYFAHRISNHFNADLILGLENIEKETFGKTKAYQSAFFITPNSLDKVRYDKRILVPMGEYIPFSWCKKICERFGIYDSYTQGNDQTLFHSKASLSTSICYEETFGHLMREGRLKGANCYVNITNDGWYPGEMLPKQHFTQARLRAVENGVPLVRACTTGVTCAVDPFGRVISSLECQKNNQVLAGALLVDTSLFNFKTPYTFFGDYLIASISILGIGIFFLAQKRKAR